MNQERLTQILVGLHITEKATALAEQKCRQIVFKVKRDALKQEIKKAVESLFNVKVKSVRTINVEGKSCAFGGRKGRHQNWKKAYVCLEEGYDINIGGAQ